MTLESKIREFKDKQAEIVRLNDEFQVDRKRIIGEFEDKKKELETKYQGMLTEAAKLLENAREKYKAELKSWVGITDGENANILDVVILAKTVMESPRD